MTTTPDALADHQAILTLLARIAQSADTGEPEDYVEHFTEDAVWDLTDATGLPLRTQTLRGRHALLAGVRERRAAGVQGPGSATRHDVSTVVVDLDGDRARSRSYFRYYLATDAQPQLAAMGTYDDEFVRTEAGWRLHRRVIGRG
ncbi:nuclear transport factor 2 family protein [Microbacterium sp. zg.Y1090]|uniref:nuclear transport factor 2 family protein n=1 Tax=Microbacterium TaxID=33882 RepID=UPI00214AC8B6|nr:MULTISPECIES: nuclear transport factor 2 family protein [unclassified Microbacterium]MCR2813305.1 nuclear transport factor 2 family protein [Microbacterium sp. zg.Y1084]MCR2819861.1 nuclear transport factor 2 family protein [Microbacterium sp. zg.Y1090]MDL5487972.1 nuclear transport factor 2 family protein [Microbacterium sp. zg-Y1211]WIM28582.1 nuclear transport factor 2 family protein [Microbacterium sp. zg-Y1090]